MRVVGKKYKGIGLYSHEQEKNTTPFQYLGQIIVGMIVSAMGGLLVYRVMVIRLDEIQEYGIAEKNIWGVGR
jgi:hypothetical protein